MATAEAAVLGVVRAGRLALVLQRQAHSHSWQQLRRCRPVLAAGRVYLLFSATSEPEGRRWIAARPGIVAVQESICGGVARPWQSTGGTLVHVQRSLSAVRTPYSYELRKALQL